MRLIVSKLYSAERRNKMKLHHLGYACLDIKKAIEAVKISQQISAVSDIIFDPFQQADICIVCLEDGSRIELVSDSSCRQRAVGEIVW